MTKPILIVEDNPDDRALLARALAKAGLNWDCAIAEDGEQGKQALETGLEDGGGVPRLVLLDLMLPKLSGLELLAWIKGHPQLARAPVVILTSSDTNVDLQRAYDLGANSYLVKPVIPAALMTMVEQIDSYWLQLNRVAA